MYKSFSFQEIFDQTKNHLLAQKEKSLDDGVCRYRLKTGDRTLMCAAGPWIPDEQYNSAMEGHDVNSTRMIFFRDNFTEDQLKLLRALQTVHDDYKVEDWEERLRSCASIFKLKYVECENEN